MSYSETDLTDDDIDLSSTPVGEQGAGIDLVETSLAIVTMPGGESPVMALASMSRARRAEHEEVWAQLFIDGAFVDVVRAAEIDSGAAGVDPDGIMFVSRFPVPVLHLDGESHRARVCFVSAVSRVIARGDAAAHERTREPSPQAIAEADFTGRIARRRAS